MPLESLGYFLGSCGWTCWRSRMASSEKIGGAATSARFAPCVWKRHLDWTRTERTFFTSCKVTMSNLSPNDFVWRTQYVFETYGTVDGCGGHVDHRRKHRSFADSLKSASEVSKSSNGVSMFRCIYIVTLSLSFWEGTWATWAMGEYQFSCRIATT